MSSVKIFWDPEGQEVDSIGQKKFLDAYDGDTPKTSMSIRMLSVDTPEVRVRAQDVNLAQLAKWIDERKAPINRSLGDYLYPKLATGRAGTLQGEQGKEATEFFKKLLDKKLTLPNGKKRNLFIYAADKHFDQYGRLLAYISPFYKPKERQAMSRKDRATFNLLMVESGWGASFPIYPSIPRMVDLAMLQEAAKKAYTKKNGIWADDDTLTGYEFRMCVKLYQKLARSKKKKWISRYCVDMTTREIFFPQEYFKVKPYNRIFIWPEDVPEAVSKMNLLPVGTST